MRVIDLSHTIEEKMPVYPGDEAPVFNALGTVDKQGYYERRLILGSHTGTHMDAPAHMLLNAPTLDRIAADRFMGPGIIIDVRRFAGGRVPMQYMQEQVAGRPEFVLLYSGWDRHWGTEAYFHDYPVLDLDAARWLAGLGLKGLGVDMISVDFTHPAGTDVHHILLGAGVLIVENLCGLDKLDQKGFTFSALPLKLKNADGSPVRATAIYC